MQIISKSGERPYECPLSANECTILTFFIVEVLKLFKIKSQGKRRTSLLSQTDLSFKKQTKTKKKEEERENE